MLTIMETIFKIAIFLYSNFLCGIAAVIETVLKVIVWLLFLILGLCLVIIYPIVKNTLIGTGWCSGLYDWCNSTQYFSVKFIKKQFS